MQTSETLIRHRGLWYLIWVYTVCQCHLYGTLDIYMYELIFLNYKKEQERRTIKRNQKVAK